VDDLAADDGADAPVGGRWGGGGRQGPEGRDRRRRVAVRVGQGRRDRRPGRGMRPLGTP